MSMRTADEPQYLIRAVVRLTGIPAATLRSWERRYGFPSPGRTATARRLYSAGDVQAITWVKAQLDQGTPIGQALQWYQSGYSGEAAPVHAERANGRATLPEPHSGESGGMLDTFVQQILGAVRDYDEGGLEAALSAAFALHPPDQVLIEVMVPALDQIGERWAEGQLAVTAEHFASNVFRRHLFNLLGQQPVLNAAPPVVLACVPGEEHDLGLLMLAVFLRWNGLHPLYLGANVPLSDLLSCLRETEASAVCLSAIDSDSTAALVEATTQVTRAGVKATVFAGGDACPQAPLGPDVHVLGSDLRVTAELIAKAARSEVHWSAALGGPLWPPASAN